MSLILTPLATDNFVPDAKVVELDFGGTAIASITTTAAVGVVELEADIIVSGDSTQDCFGKAIDGTVVSPSYNALSITGTSAIAINLAATTATSSGDFTFKGMTIEYLGVK